MSHLVGVVVASSALMYVLRQLMTPALKRLGDRLAEWLLPELQPSSYRAARGICHVARVIAPRRSSARRAAGAVLSDVDTSSLNSELANVPLRLAFSLMAPAVRGRARWIYGWVCLTGLAAVLVLTPLGGLMLAGVAAMLGRPGDMLTEARQDSRLVRSLNRLLCAYVVTETVAIVTLAGGHFLLALTVAVAAGVGALVAAIRGGQVIAGLVIVEVARAWVKGGDTIQVNVTP